MSEIVGIMSCVCAGISIIEELIELRAKMKNEDPNAMHDLLNLIKNFDKYNKREKKMILDSMKIFLEQNISLRGSAASLEEQKK
jgi:esterase/lipase